MDKATLRQYRALAQQVRLIEKEIGRMRERATSLQHPAGAQRSKASRAGAGAGFAGLVDKYVDIARQLEPKLEALKYHRRRIEKAIESLDPLEQLVVRLYYFEGMRWERVCIEINYSWRQVHRLHSSALKKMAHFGT